MSTYIIHPDTELRFVNETIGYRIYSTAPLPKGSIIYINDKLEIEIIPNKYRELDSTHQDIVE